MNNVDRIYADNSSPELFADAYIGYFSDLLREMDSKEIARAIESILRARDEGRHIFFIGNGGSAATASHFANDVAIGPQGARKPFKAISLTDNQAIITAVGNDHGFDTVFVKQLEVLFEPGDVLVAISASGDSPNLVSAAEYAIEHGGHTIALTGFGGGKLRELCAETIHVPTERGEYGPVEAVHGFLLHLIGNYLLQLAGTESGPA